jgi:hypothetical protein
MAGAFLGEVMRKAIATYNAPEGDSEVVHMGGVKFFSGHPVELNSDDHGHLISKLDTNQHFEIEVGEDDGEKKPRRGRPPKAVAGEESQGDAS